MVRFSKKKKRNEIVEGNFFFEKGPFLDDFTHCASDLTDKQAILNDYMRTHGPKSLATGFEGPRKPVNLSLGAKILQNKKLAKVMVGK